LAACRSAALVRIAAGAGFGVAAAMALVGFYMDSAVHSVTASPRRAPTSRSAARSGAAARIGWGWLADRWQVDGALLIAGMLATGSFAYAALAHSRHPCDARRS
jgi:hypothetical protein